MVERLYDEQPFTVTVVSWLKSSLSRANGIQNFGFSAKIVLQSLH